MDTTVVGPMSEPGALLHHFYRRDLAIDLDEALAVLASLPERKRDIYALKVLGFSYEEIGRITGDSYSTVNRQLVRAAALIRRARAS